jgi:hypothetical protein
MGIHFLPSAGINAIAAKEDERGWSLLFGTRTLFCGSNHDGFSNLG